jgi:hypothetical protein
MIELAKYLRVVQQWFNDVSLVQSVDRDKISRPRAAHAFRGNGGGSAVPRSRQPEIDNRAFPIRVFVRVPEEGFASLGPDLEPHRWLMRNLPSGEFAVHAGARNPYLMSDYIVVHFRSIGAATRFLDSVPVELADGTDVHFGNR